MIVAFGHQQQRGKDTSAKFLETSLKIRNPRIIIKKFSFAKTLKDACYSLYSWAGLQDAAFYEFHPDLKEVVLAPLGKSPRQIWIDFGMAVRNNVFMDTFAAKVAHDCYKSKDSVNLITDLRFPNEFEAIKGVGGLCVKVIRPSLPNPVDEADTALNHYSDSRWDKIIINDGNFKDLVEKIDSFILEKFDVKS